MDASNTQDVVFTSTFSNCGKIVWLCSGARLLHKKDNKTTNEPPQWATYSQGLWPSHYVKQNPEQQFSNAGECAGEAGCSESPSKQVCFKQGRKNNCFQLISVTKSYSTMVWARWPWKKECSQYQNQEQYIWLQVICSGGCTKHWEILDLLITLQFTKTTFPNSSMVSIGKQIEVSVPVPLLGNSTHKLTPKQSSSSHFQCAKGAKCQGHWNPSLNQQPIPPSLSLRPA